jgi:hypothetical protein
MAENLNCSTTFSESLLIELKKHCLNHWYHVTDKDTDKSTNMASINLFKDLQNKILRKYIQRYFSYDLTWQTHVFRSVTSKRIKFRPNFLDINCLFYFSIHVCLKRHSNEQLESWDRDGRRSAYGHVCVKCLVVVSELKQNWKCSTALSRILPYGIFKK